MKLSKILLGVLIFTGFNGLAQDDAERECLRMKKLAQVARMEMKDYRESAMYLIKAEEICGGLDAKSTRLLIQSIRKTQGGLTDANEKKAYADTLEGVYQRAEAAGHYKPTDDLNRATNIIQTSAPDRKKADELYARGIKNSGVKTNEAYVSYYYYNLYAMYAETPDAEKPAVKSKAISVYFEMSNLISQAGMSAKTQETISGYFNAIVKDCNDILPDLKGYLSALPSDPEVKKASVNNFISLLEKKECTDAPEYFQLVDTLVVLEPNSLDTKLKQADVLIARNKYSDGIQSYKEAKELTDDAAKTNEINYKIASALLRSGSYTSAYNTAMGVQGDLRGKAMVIAGQAVAKNANNCGASTFERQCNYIYAVQLLQQASGESVGGLIASYKQQFPTADDVFDNGSPSSVSISCYGVSVNPKQ